MSSPRVAEGAQGKKLIFCVSGGIAVFKAVQVVRDLAQLGADVRVVMTASAQRFVTAQTFASVSRNPVLTELFTSGPDVPHVELARGADLVVVAPATANALAKMALGIADDPLSATLLMSTAPLLVAPAMHSEMWEHPATVANAQMLEERGATFVGPDSGALLSGDQGPGRMAEPDAIVSAALGLLQRAQSLAGRRVVVTAGGTQEPLDPVRYLGNRSSGLMGFAIAREAVARGAKVTLVAGHTSSDPPRAVDLVRVGTAEQMRTAVLEAAPAADVVIKAAAVADFRPGEVAERKLKKAAGPPRFSLEPTPDILAELGARPELRHPEGILAGFAAETEADPGALAAVARDKLAAKGADVIVANDVASSDSGFGTRTNRAVIATRDGVDDLGLVSKVALARALVDKVAALLARRRAR
ncbi:MAG: bifunctional phosphopantothenoylcysteine decarboxylase/phosphopantothenate--cysteine ligase CoaBC [Actinomycetota bacterium]